MTLDVPGTGRILVDTAFGGDSCVVVDAAALGFDLVASEAKVLADLGVAMTNKANAQLTFTHPTNPDWTHFSCCLFVGPIGRNGSHLTRSAAVAIQPGKIDRSPIGTAASVRMALLHARGEIQEGDTPAIIPEITGRAWMTGTHQHMLDLDDPRPEGYRLAGSWLAKVTS